MSGQQVRRVGGVWSVLLLSFLGGAACGLLDPELSEFGTVRFSEVEGGCWVIDADDGKTYWPVNMPLEVRQDGLRVQFEGQRREDLTTFCPGEPIQLTWIEPVESEGS